MKRTKRRISNRILRFVRDWQSVREDRCEKIGGTGEEVFRRECATGVDTFHQGGERSGVRVSGGIRPLGVGSRARFIKIRPRVKEQAFRVPFLLPRLRSIKFYFGKIVS